ncbi:hypothetical protein GcM1_237022 [Golovinomyces cichoracearum]|uniref:Uncharacterized protein n=1 Tax=Golovinomyces cichoracearum TaxID=62708 RepID=A0A420IJS2_9PEZI|nr:hypothetical protein GcM1_237022 [Golovinomyces cichoracearum]
MSLRDNGGTPRIPARAQEDFVAGVVPASFTEQIGCWWHIIRLRLCS